jgi:hypothetical protein
MRKSVLLSAILCFLFVYPLESQGLLNKVKKAVSNEISGVTDENNGNNSSEPGPEPACACANAKLILDLGGKYKIDYKEISISIKDDGSLLVKDKVGNKYYIVRDGVSQGPYDESDPHVKEFGTVNEEVTSGQGVDDWRKRYPDYITRSGEKYLIKFNGKNYGSYAIISDFAVSRSKDKFAAVVTESIMVTEDQGKKMEEAMKNAKTDQERMDIAMKFSQQMQNQLTKDGGVSSIQPKIISNVAGASYDLEKWMGGRLNGEVKIDELLVITPDKIMDMQGNTIMKLNQNSYNLNNLYVNSSNTRYASYNYGALTFSDNTTLSDLFNPYLIRTDGKVYLTYMYYSPGKNAIMQCAIPF